MGKCFLGLGFGALAGAAYFVSELSRGWHQADLGHCLSGAMEWVYIGGFLTMCAIGGYAVYLAVDRLAGGNRR